MKLKSILTLAITAMVLVVMGTGNAFAYTWADVDYSKLVSSSDADSVGSVYGCPDVRTYSVLTWQNTLVNDYGGAYYGKLTSRNEQNYQPAAQQSISTLSYRASWSPNAENTAITLPKDNTWISVIHHYEIARGTTSAWESFTQYYNAKTS